ncbi:MAG TPA: phosphate butyryltransferase [candidate division Zixibacteria bacterium]|nr:phosphate butyryltransferase [candidate division Zixibacteria bacterium]
METKIEPISSSDMIIEAAARLSESGRKKMVAVAGAQDTAVIGALSSANADGILNATLFGDKGKITEIASKEKIDISKLDVVDKPDPQNATYEAVKMAAEGNADVFMKGFVSTSALLKTVLSREFNLRTKNTVSHTAVLDIPGYHKLLSMTDGGMVVRPDLSQKIQIIENAVLVNKALGISPVKVALGGAVDAEYNSVPSSLECTRLIEMFAERGNENVLMQGPLAFDTATSKEIAKAKNIDGPVVGEADIYLVSSLEECNIIAKSLINFADTVFAGVITGARVPISLVSRTDTLKNKKASVSIACLVAEYYKIIGFGEAS